MRVLFESERRTSKQAECTGATAVVGDDKYTDPITAALGCTFATELVMMRQSRRVAVCDDNTAAGEKY